MTMLNFGAIVKEFTAKLHINTTEKQFYLDTKGSFNTVK
jgi:hypothetical protein